MPFIGLIMAGINLKALSVTLPWTIGDNPPVTILFGSFLQSIITFLLTAICVFAIVKVMNVIKDKTNKKKKEEAPAAPPAPDPQIVLLTEIRDLLKTQSTYYETDENIEETEE